MKLYQEKLVEYKKKEENFRKAERDLKIAMQNLKDYVQSCILSRDYTIERIELRDGYELFYPALSIPEGFEKRSEEFFCDSPEGFVLSDPEERFVTHKYTLVDEKSMLEINVSEESLRMQLEYNNANIYLKVKDNIIVMDNNIEYNIKIGEMKFQFKRNFMDSIKKVLLTDILKDKYICYRDFANTRAFKLKGHKRRYVVNYLLKKKIQPREIIQGYVNRYSTCCDIEKIISDVEEFTKQDSGDRLNDKLYCLRGVGTLRVAVCRIYNNNHCIIYQDKHLIVEIPIPLKEFNLWITVIKKDYDEVLAEGISEKDIQEEDKFVFNLNDLDMDKQMKLLDMLGL